MRMRAVCSGEGCAGHCLTDCFAEMLTGVVLLLVHTLVGTVTLCAHVLAIGALGMLCGTALSALAPPGWRIQCGILGALFVLSFHSFLLYARHEHSSFRVQDRDIWSGRG